MKTLEELKNTPHLVINGKMGPFPAEDEVYGGFVSWPDFMGSVVFGMNEGGRMEHVSISSKKRHQLPTWPVMVRLKNMFFPAGGDGRADPSGGVEILPRPSGFSERAALVAAEGRKLRAAESSGSVGVR